MIIVAVADFTKRAGVEWGDIGVRLSKHVSMRIRQNGLIAPLLPRNGSGSGGGDIGNVDVSSLPDHNDDNGDGLDYYYGSNSSKYLATQGSMGLGEVESEVPEDVLPTITLVPPATATPSMGNNSRSKNNKLLGLGDSQSNGSRKSLASEVELMVSPPISRQRSPVRGAQTFPVPFDAPADTTTSSGVGGGGGDAAARTHPTRRSQTLGYDELLHMPAKEYRQRALADMAAAGSFYKGRGASTAAAAAAEAVAGLDALDESEEEEEGEEGGVIRDEEQGEYTPPEVPPLETRDDTEQNLSAPPPISAAGAPGGDRAVSAPATLSLPPALSLPHPKEYSGGQYGRVSPPEMIIEEGEEPTKFDQRLAILSQALELAATPVMILLKSTIPIVEMTSYNKFWFLLAMAASPLFICIYFGALFSFSNFAIAVLVGALSSSLCALCTRNLNENEAPLLEFGTGYPLGAGLIAFYGFAVAAMWIDIFASEIVGFLHFFGLLAGIHPAVLGVTVLAWGNSLTDYVANTSMAGRSGGGTSMAMTACFAGPLFNMLVGLGIGFWAYLAETKQKSTPVNFDSVVLVGCVFAMLNCAGVIATAVKNKHHLPSKFGWVMCGWYLLYMLVVLIMSAS